MVEERISPYYTRIPKAADWSRINLRLIDEELDLAGWDVDSFNRRLDMKEGISYRDMEVTSPRGNQLRIHVEHITNMARPNLCLIKYSVSSINYTGRISLVPILDGNIVDDADLQTRKYGTYCVLALPAAVPISGHRPAGKMHKCATP